MTDNFNKNLVSQVEIEIVNNKTPNKSLFKLEDKLRKDILYLHNVQANMDAYEINELITGAAERLNFKNVQVEYQMVITNSDGSVVLVFKATIDKYQCFIYIKNL